MIHSALTVRCHRNCRVVPNDKLISSGVRIETPAHVCAGVQVGSSRSMHNETSETAETAETAEGKAMTSTITELLVTLSVPNDASFLRLVRLIVSSTAADLGFDFEEVEDLRIVADEVVNLAMENTLPNTTVQIQVFPSGPELRLEVSGHVKDAAHPGHLDPLSKEIVAGLGGSFSVAVVDVRFEASFWSCPPKTRLTSDD